MIKSGVDYVLIDYPQVVVTISSIKNDSVFYTFVGKPGLHILKLTDFTEVYAPHPDSLISKMWEEYDNE
jgi:hypothetical protein